jgi:maleamate amidohydrolase
MAVRGRPLDRSLRRGDGARRDRALLPGGLVKAACGSATTAMHETGILNLANRRRRGHHTAGACRLMAGETVAAWQIEGAVPLRFGYLDAALLYRAL